MTWLTIVFVFIILLGAVNLSYQVYKITELDRSEERRVGKECRR